MGAIIGAVGLLGRVLGGLPARDPGADREPGRRAAVGLAAVLHGAGGWILAGAAGLVTPAWTAALAALSPIVLRGATLPMRLPNVLVGAAADLLLLVPFVAFAAVRPGPASLAAVTLLFLAAGRLGDRLAARLPDRRRAAWQAGAAAFVLLVGAAELLAYRYLIWGQTRATFRVAVALPNPGRPVDLGTGAAAWYAAPDGSEGKTAVLLLHGAHPAGSRQSTAVAFRTAALAQGYPVLSLDAVGYGRTASPSRLSDPGAWDERPSLAAAIRHVENLGRRVVVVGHSMGGVNALHALDTEAAAGVERVVLLGTGMLDFQEHAAYWHERFHEDRRLPDGAVTLDAWREIEARVLSGLGAVRRVPADHPPVLAVEFALEHENVARTRGRFGELLPGGMATTRLEGSNHYLNSRPHGPITLVDAGVIRRLREALPAWLDDDVPGADDDLPGRDNDLPGRDDGSATAYSRGDDS